MVSWVNQFPMLYKHKVMRINSGNLRANMMIYKELGSKENAPYVGLETEGPVGCYNRANRSLFHFTDTWCGNVQKPWLLYIPGKLCLQVELYTKYFFLEPVRGLSIGLSDVLLALFYLLIYDIIATINSTPAVVFGIVALGSALAESPLPKENSLAFVVCFVLAGIIFPLPVLALTAAFSVGRMMHQIGSLAEVTGTLPGCNFQRQKRK